MSKSGLFAALLASITIFATADQARAVNIAEVDGDPLPCGEECQIPTLNFDVEVTAQSRGIYILRYSPIEEFTPTRPVIRDEWAPGYYSGSSYDVCNGVLSNLPRAFAGTGLQQILENVILKGNVKLIRNGNATYVECVQ